MNSLIWMLCPLYMKALSTTTDFAPDLSFPSAFPYCLLVCSFLTITLSLMKTQAALGLILPFLKRLLLGGSSGEAPRGPCLSQLSGAISYGADRSSFSRSGFLWRISFSSGRDESWPLNSIHKWWPSVSGLCYAVKIKKQRWYSHYVPWQHYVHAPFLFLLELAPWPRFSKERQKRLSPSLVFKLVV